MIEHVTIERKSDDGLTQWTWRFYYDAQTLWLDYYSTAQRATRRHGFSVTECYSRLNIRASTMQESDVVLPADLKEEAIKKFCERITVKRWNDGKAA